MVIRESGRLTIKVLSSVINRFSVTFIVSPGVARVSAGEGTPSKKKESSL